MTTATAFGSLWLSDEPGISSMGKLMVLALACTLAAAVLFQPILMGPPRRSRGDTPAAAKSAAEG
jgi:predicted RND superfamily exporter protein